MRHKVGGRKLSRSTGLRQKLFRSLITQFFSHGRITTTEAKAKSVRGDVERLITVAKNSNREDAVAWMNARRQVDRVVCDKTASLRLFDELAPKFRERKGGYTRLYKVGPRQGDGAPMVVLELVEK